ncbi:RNA polymerase sigma-70 factor [Agromyces silvae]|uniref:RNA polymerase sigma-70 factor n=1 Tax=Agromyces silvae TaxID=3388266 RepID=UPI00280A87AC|nr:RNA polymerase sigma-70 factor [Agromyces protaetiae]
MPDHHAPTRAQHDEAAAVFAGVRPRLFGIAYRMLGSVADAEDIVQDTWLRWHQYDRAQVHDPAAFLATTTTRLAINELKSARVRHEAYVGPWLPEPVDTGANPELKAERAELLHLATLLLMERLTPMERAAFVLREAFDYGYDQIARILRATEESARQLVSRARKHLAAERRTPVEASDHRELLAAFLDAAQSGDLTRLESILSADVVSTSDGGGLAARAARVPMVGRERVAKFVTAFSSWFWEGVDVRWIEANDQPAVLLTGSAGPVAMLAIEPSPAGIDRLYWVLNPAKLGGVLPSAD